MINVKGQRFLDMVTLLRKQLMVVYCSNPKTREQKG